MSIAILGAGFLMGFLGSPHCLGMCGGIVSAFGISMQTGQASAQKKTLLTTSYHLGRLISYMALGVVAASLGATVFAPFMGSQMPRILLGLALVFVALLMLGLPILKNIEKVGLGLWTRLSPVRQKLFPLNTTPKALSAGLLWGLLPCGLVYGALVMAVSLGTTGGADADLGQNILTGMAFMLAFGLGTTPMLLATHTVVAFLQKTINRFSLRRASGVLMLLSGLMVAIPAMTHNHHGHHGHEAHSHHEHTQHGHTNHAAKHDHASHTKHNEQDAHNHANHDHTHVSHEHHHHDDHGGAH